MTFTTLFFDLDDTLYAPSSGVWQAIMMRIEQYMHERLNIPTEEIPGLREDLFRKYGTTLRGLQILWHVDEREFVEYVHDVPVDRLLSPDPALRKPMPEAFAIAMRRAGVENPQECLFLDDGLNNVSAARALGFYTVWVGSREPSDNCHASIAAVGELSAVLDPLLRSN